jgi:hypothetical protein
MSLSFPLPIYIIENATIPTWVQQLFDLPWWLFPTVEGIKLIFFNCQSGEIREEPRGGRRGDSSGGASRRAGGQRGRDRSTSSDESVKKYLKKNSFGH